MKKSGLFLISLMVLILSLGVLSCEVGLGEQVDTVAPTVKIETPDSSSVIRDDFILGGTWTDDGSITDITVSLRRTSEDFEETHSFKGEIVGKEWFCYINPEDPREPITDGDYEASVVFTDNGGHKTPMARAFTIDNTAPVVVLERPASMITDSDKDPFGQSIVFVGEAYDKCNVSQIAVNFYKDETDCQNLQNPLTEKPVIKKGISNSVNVNVANFLIDADIYKKIYNGDSEVELTGTQGRYYSVMSYDNAKKYPASLDEYHTFKNLPDDDSTKIEASLGNSTTDYYLRKNEQITSLIEGNGLKVSDFYEMINNVYYKKHPSEIKHSSTESVDNNSRNASEVPSTPDTVAKTPFELLTSAIIKGGSFSLNPDNNPTYAISGKEQLTGFDDFKNNELTNNATSQIILDLNRGLDKSSIRKNTIRVFAYPVTSGNYEKVLTYLKTEIKPDDTTGIQGTAIEFKNKDVADGFNANDKSTWAIDIKDNGMNFSVNLWPAQNKTSLNTGTNYLIGVSGIDWSQNSFKPYTFENINKDQMGYGFSYQKAGVSTGISITKVELGNNSTLDNDGNEIPLYFNNKGTLKITGNIKYDDKKDDLGLTVTFGNKTYKYGKDKNPQNPDFTWITKDNQSDKIFSCSVNVGECGFENKNDGQQELKCTLTYYNSKNEAQGNPATATKTLILDKKAPELNVQYPTSSNFVVSNTETFRGIFSDFGSGVDKMTCSIYEGDKVTETSKKTIDIAGADIVGLNWTKNFNEILPEDKEGKYTLSLVGFDKVGNKTEPVNCTFDYDKAAPVITVNKDLPKEGITVNNIVDNRGDTTSKSITISGTVIETNGLKDLTVTDGKTVYSIGNKTITRDKDSWTLPIENISEGKHVFVVKAVDVLDRTTELAPITIMVDRTPPTGDLELGAASVQDSSGKSVYGNKISLTVKNCKDTASPIKEVVAKIGKDSKFGEDVILRKDDSGNNYVGDVYPTEDGENTIKVVITEDFKFAHKYELTKTVKVDTVAPVVKNVNFATKKKVIKDEENTNFAAYNNAETVYGAQSDKPGILSNAFNGIKISLNANDSSGIKSVTATLNCGSDNKTVTNTVTTPITSETESNTYQVELILPKDVVSGDYPLTYTVTDNAGMVTEKTVQVQVDNTAPVAKVLGPKADAQLTGNVNVFGNMDSTGYVYYGISKSASTEPTTYSRIKDAGLSWNVYFDNDTDKSKTSAHDKYLNDYLIDLYTEITDENIKNGSYDTLTSLYIWIKAVDDAGNVNGKYNQELTVDPQGDRPTVNLSSPAQGDTVGGLITFYGTSLDLVGLKEDTIGVDSIWGQFISGYTPVKQAKEGETTPESFEITASQLNALAKLKGADGKSTPFAEKIYYMRDGKTAWNVDGTNAHPAKDYGIKLVDATKLTGASWSCRINEKSEFNPEGEATTNNVGVQFFAKDKDGKLSKGVASYVKVDADAPTFDETYITITDSNGANARSIPYSDGMYISAESTDKIYLDGIISDNFRVANIYVGGDNVTAQLYENTNISSEGTGTAKVDANNYAEFKNGKEGTDIRGTCKFKIPVTTPAPKGGLAKLKITLQASDGKSSRDNTLNINFDKKVPDITVTDISTEVKQSNSFFTFGGQITEMPGVQVETKPGEKSGEKFDQSGLDFVAAYFVRDGKVYNPMFKDNNATAIKIKDKTNLKLDSGIYWFTDTNVSLKGSALTVTSVNGNKNIHKNGLVKFDGVIYKIMDIQGNVITLNKKPKPSATTTAYFANALVIDNPIQEMGDPNSQLNSDGYFETVMNDDGDGMVDVAKKKDATWTWSASVNSKNIPDGAIDIHYVAFDNAGNCTEPKVVSGKIVNNRPRIAGFKFTEKGKDENVVYSITNESNYKKYITSVPNVVKPEENEFNWDKIVNDKSKPNALPTDPIFGDSSAPVAVLGDETVITPEIVGGNGEIYFKYEIGEVGKQWTGINPSAVVTTIAENYKVNTVATPITLQKGDLYTVGGKFDKASIEGIPFKFTFADSTWSTTEYTDANSRFSNADSQKASMTIYFQLKGVGGAPTATIDPFYWKNKIDNSLFKNSAEEGHIELGADWEKAPGFNDESLDAKLRDTDDKVSGKIKIEGNVSDDAGLASITFKLGNNGNDITVNVSEIKAYDTIAAESDWGKNGYYIYYKSEPLKDGDDIKSLNYVLVWDTSKVNSNMVGLNEVITIKAKNKGTPKMGTADTGPLSIDGTTHYGKVTYDTATAKETATPPTVQVDVVPYITSFKKSGNVNYPRTKSGAYSLARNDSGLVFGGLNIPSTASVNIVTKAKTKIAVKVDNGICTIPSNAISGDFEASVNIGTDTENWIPAINSINNNDAEYNREASGLDSIFNIISYPDDKYVHVWQVSDKDIFQGSMNCFIPTMTKDPVTGKLYAAFSNGGYGSVFTSSALIGSGTLKEADVDNAVSNAAPDKKLTSPLAGVNRIYSYNFAASNIDIAVSKDKTGKQDKDIGVAYGAVYRTEDEKTWPTPGTNHYAKFGGGMYFYDNQDGYNASNTTTLLNGSRAVRAYRGQLYCYDQYIDQFKNMRVARNGDYIYSAYYDEKNKSINFSVSRPSRDKSYSDDKIGNFNGNEQQALPWISIDGGMMPELEVLTTADIKFKGVTNTGYFVPQEKHSFPVTNNDQQVVQVGSPFNLNATNRSAKTGEYVGLALTQGKTGGYPVIVYMGADKGEECIKIARTKSVSGTLGYMKIKNSNNVLKDDLTKAPETLIQGSNYNPYDITGTERSKEWAIQKIDGGITSKYGVPTGYIECAIDKNNYLHIVYKTLTGNLVYLKSSNNPVDGKVAYTFADDSAQLVDKGGSNISIDVDDNCTPYISYIGTADSTDGMKIAVPNTRKDKNPATLDDFETMCAPSKVLVKDNKTCIQTNALDNAGAKYKAAVGVFNGSDYRAMYYVGEEATTTTGQ